MDIKEQVTHSNILTFCIWTQKVIVTAQGKEDGDAEYGTNHP